MDSEQDQPDVPDGRGVTDGLVDEIGIVEESVRLDELADGDQIDVRVGDPNPAARAATIESVCQESAAYLQYLVRKVTIHSTNSTEPE